MKYNPAKRLEDFWKSFFDDVSKGTVPYEEMYLKGIRSTGLTRSALNKYSNENYGVGVGELYHRCRLQAVCQKLLGEPTIDLKAVAKLFGYKDLAELDNQFTRFKRMSIHQWRRANH